MLRTPLPPTSPLLFFLCFPLLLGKYLLSVLFSVLLAIPRRRDTVGRATCAGGVLHVRAPLPCAAHFERLGADLDTQEHAQTQQDMPQKEDPGATDKDKDLACEIKDKEVGT